MEREDQYRFNQLANVVENLVLEHNALTAAVFGILSQLPGVAAVKITQAAGVGVGALGLQVPNRGSTEQKATAIVAAVVQTARKDQIEEA